MARTEQARPRAERTGTISAGIDIDDGELDRRKAFLEITADDVGNLVGINDLAQRYADAVIEDFYSHLLGFEETRKFFADPQVLKRVKNLQKDYFLRLTQAGRSVTSRAVVIR